MLHVQKKSIDLLSTARLLVSFRFFEIGNQFGPLSFQLLNLGLQLANDILLCFTLTRSILPFLRFDALLIFAGRFGIGGSWLRCPAGVSILRSRGQTSARRGSLSLVEVILVAARIML